MTDFRSFVYKIGGLFALPWLLLIVWPTIQYANLKPIAYDKEKGDELDNAYSYPMNPPANAQGAVIYAQEGCVQCHTQVVRSPEVTLDGWRKGWGADQEAKPEAPARATTIRDYLGEKHAFLGISRSGPDLANAGYRFTNRTDVHMHLYQPRALTKWSNAPAYKHLYTERQIQAQPSAKALPLTGKHAPKAGYEVIPTAEAETLVDYVLSLKRDYAKPNTVKPVAAAAPAKK
jgi:cytochrome c oxidase cbb3-type subunit II